MPGDDSAPPTGGVPPGWQDRFDALDDPLTAAEVGSFLGVDPKVVRRWVRERQLPSLRLPGTYRISKEDLRAFVAASSRPDAAHDDAPAESGDHEGDGT
jgi:excisionase family DNA binding protein